MDMPWRLSMAQILADRRLPMAILLVLVIAGCAAGERAPSASTATGTSSPTPSPLPSQASAPSPSTAASPNAHQTASPTPGPWRAVPSQASFSGVQFLDVVWTGARFVAVGGGLDGITSFVDSTDGVDWHRQTGSGTSWAPMSLAAGPGGVVAVGSIREHPASWFSSDGLTWTPRPDAFPTPPLGSDSVEVTDVIATDAGWLAVGRQDPACQLSCLIEPKRALAWTSADGSHWTRVAAQKAFEGGGITAVTRGPEGFVAVGIAARHAAIWTSPDGVGWSRVPDDRMFGDVGTTGPAAVTATGVATHDGIVVAVGMTYDGDPASVFAWWSTDGRVWPKGVVDLAAGGQVFSATATPDGFLAVGPSGGQSCRGGIWASTDGRRWRCDASAPAFEGFAPYAAAASDTVEVAVGLGSAAVDESPDGEPGAAWYRTTR
jgi:hypothetical protein